MTSTTTLVIQHRNKLILMGDLNARVGNDHQVWDSVLGQHGVGHMNSNGLRLHSICRKFNLVIRNTHFPQPSCRRISWMHHQSKDWHLIDYIITKKRDLRDINITLFIPPFFIFLTMFSFVVRLPFILLK